LQKQEGMNKQNNTTEMIKTTAAMRPTISHRPERAIYVETPFIFFLFSSFLDRLIRLVVTLPSKLVVLHY